MKSLAQHNASAWGHQSVLDFFDHQRLTTNHIYPSEWFFISQQLRPGMSILDIGCAKGGFANVLTEHLNDFTYVGVDINADMINAAKARHPHHQFHLIEENNYQCLRGQQFDLVLSLGILHLHETWRETIQLAWRHTAGAFIFDLRETHLETIEDKNIAHFKTDYDAPDVVQGDYLLPYNIINHTVALKNIHTLCGTAAKKISVFGYTQKISRLAVSPIQEVFANVYCIDKN